MDVVKRQKDESLFAFAMSFHFAYRFMGYNKPVDHLCLHLHLHLQTKMCVKLYYRQSPSLNQKLVDKGNSETLGLPRGTRFKKRVHNFSICCL